MSIELKVKAKSLADEARIIRAEELKLKPVTVANWSIYDSLHRHRVGVVRDEARMTHLARAFLRGMPYARVEYRVREQNVLNEYDFKRIAAMISKYGRDVHPEFDWKVIKGWTEVTAPAKAA